jgi:hypothetical protein
MTNTSLPLNKTTHFRRLREVITKLSQKANVNISKYNLQKIVCYRSTGMNLMGKNVLTLNSLPNRCCFVKDNDYEIYECLSTTNKEKFTGKYLMAAHNVDFDYWMLIEFEYKIKIKSGKGYVNVTYDPKNISYVKYQNKDEVSIQAFNHPHKYELGANVIGIYFDSEFSRTNAYQTTVQQYVLDHSKHNNDKIATDKQVVKYNRRKK